MTCSRENGANPKNTVHGTATLNTDVSRHDCCMGMKYASLKNDRQRDHK